MDLNENLLWHLGRYDNVCLAFLELLRHKLSEDHRDEIWSLVVKVVNEKQARLLAGEDMIAGAGVFAEPWQQLRTIYSGQHHHRSTAAELVFYARVLSMCSSHGDGPWNGAKRLVQQFYDERTTLNELPSRTRLQPVVEESTQMRGRTLPSSRSA